MTTWTTPRTWGFQEIPSSANMNAHIRDNELYLKEVLAGTNADKIPFAAHDNNAWVVPQCHVRLTTTWVMVNNAETAINFSAADIWDTDNIHDPSVTNTRLRPNTKGMYLAYCSLAFPGNATGQRMAKLNLNGITNLSRHQIGAAGATQIALNTHTVYPFNGTTDYVEMYYFQDSGGSLTNPGVGNYSTEFGLIWLSSY